MTAYIENPKIIVLKYGQYARIESFEEIRVRIIKKRGDGVQITGSSSPEVWPGVYKAVLHAGQVFTTERFQDMDGFHDGEEFAAIGSNGEIMIGKGTVEGFYYTSTTRRDLIGGDVLVAGGVVLRAIFSK